jgi:inner membrane protein
MLGKTHLFYGVTIGAALAVAVVRPARWWPESEVVLFSALGALLPDLDEPGSTISNAPRILGRTGSRLLHLVTDRTPLRLLGVVGGALIGLAAGLLNLLSRALSWLVRVVSGGHREGSHWLPVWAGLSVAVLALTVRALGPWAAIGFSAGYLSHLAADGCTRSGLPLVPATGRRLHLLPRLLRVRTGSVGETVATAAYAAAFVGLAVVVMTHQGHARVGI